MKNSLCQMEISVDTRPRECITWKRGSQKEIEDLDHSVNINGKVIYACVCTQTHSCTCTGMNKM